MARFFIKGALLVYTLIFILLVVSLIYVVVTAFRVAISFKANEKDKAKALGIKTAVGVLVCVLLFVGEGISYDNQRDKEYSKIAQKQEQQAQPKPEVKEESIAVLFDVTQFSNITKAELFSIMGVPVHMVTSSDAPKEWSEYDLPSGDRVIFKTYNDKVVSMLISSAKDWTGSGNHIQVAEIEKLPKMLGIKESCINGPKGTGWQYVNFRTPKIHDMEAIPANNDQEFSSGIRQININFIDGGSSL